MVEAGPKERISAHDCRTRYRKARTRVDELIAAITSWSDETADGWTAKDYLAHLTAWQRQLVRWFEEGEAGTPRQWPEPGFSFDQVDALNERDWRASRGTPLDQVRREFEESADGVEALIARLTDDDLNNPARVPWLGFEARHAIAGNTYGHYAEHYAVLEQLASERA